MKNKNGRSALNSVGVGFGLKDAQQRFIITAVAAAASEPKQIDGKVSGYVFSFLPQAVFSINIYSEVTNEEIVEQKWFHRYIALVEKCPVNNVRFCLISRI
jgi:hypothetical protein